MADWAEHTGQNVFEMLNANGGPDFWLRRITWGATCARVIAVGRFTGPPPYFGNPSILMDVYKLDGTLKDALVPIRAPGTYRTWRWISVPSWVGTVNLRSLDDPRIKEALYKLDKKRHKLPGMRYARSESNVASSSSSTQVKTSLTVPFARKDEAKRLGARWDPEARTWWLPSDAQSALQRARAAGFLSD